MVVAQPVAAPEQASVGREARTRPHPLGGTARQQAVIRRRRIVLGLAALTSLALVAVVGSGGAAAWWALLTTVAAGSGYLYLLHRTRRVMAEREFAVLRDLQPDPFGRSLRRGPVTDRTSPGRSPSHTWALVRFMLANLGGWALAPIVFGLTLLLGEEPRDATGQRWLANLRVAQVRLREGSMRTLAISAATTASVAAAGTVATLAVAGPASASTISGTAGATTYTVVAGDTLGAIAARYGTTPAALAALNHLANPNLIHVGQVLVLQGSPTSGDPSWGAPAGATHTVVAGDTLGAIAARYGTTAATLAALNHLTNPNLLYVGQVLVLTGGGSSRVAPPAATPAPAATYRVVAGDTLGAIAARYGTTAATLAAVNHLTNSNLLYAGQVLVLAPEPARAAASLRARSSAPAPASSAAAVAVQVARQQVGKPYQYGGAGPSSFDCSGLVRYAWAAAGVSLPHYSVAQYQDTRRITAGQVRPGDLVFYDNGAGAQPGHVTIYIGNGQIITADSPGTVVRIEAVDWDGIPMGYGRVL
jgi:LysM repeat protein